VNTPTSLNKLTYEPLTVDATGPAPDVEAVTPVMPSPTGTRPSVTIVVPAYNEALILMQSLTTLEEFMDGLADRYEWQMLVVNDGSKDETGAIAEAFASSRPHVRALHHKTNFNLGQVLRYAFANCTTDYVVTVDCDMSYSVDHIGRLLDAIHQTHAKVVLASPYAAEGTIGNVPFVRRKLSLYANRMLSFSVKGELSTLTGMVRAYDRIFLQSLDLSSTDVGINTEIIYKARILKAKVVEIPATLSWVSEEPGGRKSKFKIRKSVGTYLMSGFLFRPLLTLAFPAMSFFLVSLALFLFVLTRAIGDKTLSQSLADWPTTTVIAALSFGLSVQFFSLALLAEQQRRNFEYLFHLGTTGLKSSRLMRERT
jgi:glycosyltransferase involved in cell wall biosynthesis